MHRAIYIAMDFTTVALVAGVVVIAFLYSSVGHAGASGYIALMSLFSIAPSVIKPSALLLNVLVASIATWQFARAGHFSWRLFWPFAVVSTPFALLGGYVNLPTHIFKVLVGIVLLLSAFRLLARPTADTVATAPTRPIAFSVGGFIGLLAGLTGTGGGIFLTPLMLFMRWAYTKTVAAVSAAFVLTNSVAGLAGNLSSTRTLPTVAIPLAVAALSGGIMGSYLGAQRFDHTVIKRLLAVVLLIAGSKLIFTS